MSTTFRYSRPDESFIGAGVTGTVDTDFTAGSLCNGAPGDPVKHTGGLSLTATALASTEVGVVAACNSNIPASGTVTVGGGVVAGTITMPSSLPANGIPLNPYLLPTPASGTVVTISTSATIIGELWAGKVRTLERGLRVDTEYAMPAPFEWEGEFGSIPPNDDGTEARTLTGEAVVSGTGLTDIEEWYRSTRRGTRPTLIIPFDGVQDAWLVTFSYRVKIGWKSPLGTSASIYTVSFEFRELPRTRW